MTANATELHLVQSFPQALEVAHDLRALGIGLDLEGVLLNYVGNDPDEIGPFNECLFAPAVDVLFNDMQEHPDVQYGIMTNNKNLPLPYDGEARGIVELTAELLDVPYVHKGMEFYGQILEAKPSGSQGDALADIMDLDPAAMVLIDDQAVRNAGEAVSAHFQAIISPPPIGDPWLFGHVKEHGGVMASRFVEPAVIKSYEHDRWLGRTVFERFGAGDLAGIVRH